MRGSGVARGGGILGSLLIGLPIVAAMVAVSIPVVASQRRADEAEACQLNLVRIQNAKVRYAVDHDLAAGSTVTLEELIKACPKQLPTMPECPGGGKYAINTIGTTATCSLEGQGHRIIKRLPVAGLASDNE